MSTNSGKVPRAEALKVVRGAIEGHAFSPATVERDVNFAHNTLRWLFDQFVMYDTDISVQSDLWGGYPSTELPASIQPLFIPDTYVFGERRPLSASSALHRVVADEVIPAVIPVYQALRDVNMSYPAIIEHFTKNPGDLVGACLTKSYVMTRYGVSIRPGFTSISSWGIRLESDARNISVYPYGVDGETEPPSNWMLTYLERLHILAQVIVYAGYLTVKDSTHCQEKIDETQLENLQAKLEEPAPEVGTVFRYSYGESMEGEILKVLVTKNVVSAVDLKR